VSTRAAVALVAGMSALLFLQIRSVLLETVSPHSSRSAVSWQSSPHPAGGGGGTSQHLTQNSIHSLRQTQTRSVYGGNRDEGQDQDQCKFYLAESAIPMGGMGIFTAAGLHPGEVVGIPDICIFVSGTIAV